MSQAQLATLISILRGVQRTNVVRERTMTGFERVCAAVHKNPNITLKRLARDLRSRCMAIGTLRQYHWAARKALTELNRQ